MSTPAPETAAPAGATISTHVLDVTTGRPAPGVSVRLERPDDGGWTEIGGGTTDAGGRLRKLEPDGGAAGGRYRLVFGIGDYYRAAGLASFFPEVTVDFAIADTAEHYHVPLLAGPYSYATYRGG